MVKIARATIQDVERLAPNLRQVDRDEITLAYGADPMDALWASYYASDMCWAATEGEDVVAVFGCGDHTPWLLGSELMSKVSRAIVRHSRLYIYFMLRQYGFLWNYVWHRNTVSIRWLRWCGFYVLDPVPYGQKGELFHPFFMMHTKYTARPTRCAPSRNQAE